MNRRALGPYGLTTIGAFGGDVIVVPVKKDVGKMPRVAREEESSFVQIEKDYQRAKWGYLGIGLLLGGAFMHTYLTRIK